MKTIIIAIILFLPCLAVLNESESFLPNLCGLAYIVGLFTISWTKAGKQFCKKLYIEIDRVNEIIFKK